MNVAITHSSTACLLIEIGSVRILTDPVLDREQKRRYRFGPFLHRWRRRGPGIPPETLDPIDAVLLSHAHHADNLDESGRAFLSQAGEVITSPKGRRFLGGGATGLRPWEETTIFGRKGEKIRVTATPALHGPVLLSDSHGVTGFVLEWEGQKHGALYISGDTIFCNGVRYIGWRFDIGTAILHLGAVNFWPWIPPFFRFTFNGREAAQTAKDFGARTIIPVHYEREVWDHFRESRESYENEFRKAGIPQNAVNWLDRGKRTLVEV